MDEIGSEIYAGLARQGPGGAESTRRAFSMLQNVPPHPAVLDVGCGTGLQTVEVAKLSGGIVTALDTNKDFLAEAEQRAHAASLDEKIKTVEGSMFAMPFKNDSFDLIWSEGAIYIIGFQKGLKEWRRFLKDSGYLATTHISWLKPDVPDELRAHWDEAYPLGIKQIDENLDIATKEGYCDVGHFTLPESDWLNEYYAPIEAKLPQLREKYAANDTALNRIEETQREIDTYKKYFDYYGYVFYILQKTS